MPRSVLLAGATGLIGSQILQGLIRDEDVFEVRLLVRKPLDRTRVRPKVRELIADFDALGAHPEWFRVDQVFSALGTTIRQAGSQEAFRRVDRDYPLTLAQLAHAQGARHFLLVSSAGADSRSRVFYCRVKGEAEEAVRGVGYNALTIARPSFLLGPRTDLRVGEIVMKRLASLLPSSMKPVPSRKVASALVRAAREDNPGVVILDNLTLRREGPD